MDEIKLKIKEIIAHDLDAGINMEDITDDISLYDDGLGLDSIAIINFIVLLEKKFEISLDESEISAKLFSSVNTLAELLNAKINAGAIAIDDGEDA
jgi:acyl carrier protein